MKITERSMTYPEFVRFRAEGGLSSALTQTARRHRLTVSEYVRNAVRAKLTADGANLPALDGPDQREAA